MIQRVGRGFQGARRDLGGYEVGENLSSEHYSGESSPGLQGAIVMHTMAHTYSLGIVKFSFISSYSTKPVQSCKVTKSFFKIWTTFSDLVKF